MKRVTGLIVAVLTILLISAPSYGNNISNNWFPQQPKSKTPEIEVQPKEKELPNTVPQTPAPSTTARSLFLHVPCDRFDKMSKTVTKYKEELLFTATGLTFGPQRQPFNGTMMFFVNQDTGSYTVLQVFKDGMACMIINGKNFEPYTGDQPYNK